VPSKLARMQLRVSDISPGLCRGSGGPDLLPDRSNTEALTRNIGDEAFSLWARDMPTPSTDTV
jgi:hypothetical protein